MQGSSSDGNDVDSLLVGRAKLTDDIRLEIERAPQTGSRDVGISGEFTQQSAWFTTHCPCPGKMEEVKQKEQYFGTEYLSYRENKRRDCKASKHSPRADLRAG